MRTRQGSARRAWERLTKSKMPIETRKIELPNEVILGDASAMLAKGKDVTISTKGNSMLPFIRGGVDSVVLRKIHAVHRGDIVLAQIFPGRYVLHRVFREPKVSSDGRLSPNARITLMGDGNVRGTENCRASDICGTVIRIIRPDGQISRPQSKSRQFVATLWRWLLPVRRYLLFIYRHTFLKKNRHLRTGDASYTGS